MKIGKELLYLSKADMEKADIPMKQYIDILEQGFKAKTEGTVDMPMKVEIVPHKGAWFHAMPCYVGGEVDASGMKWISMNRDNPPRGFAALNGVMIMSDSDTCLPMAIMDCIHITGMRTGAASGLAFRLFARGDETVAGVIGCGLQGRTNLEALLCECPNVKTVYVWGPRKPSVDKYVAEMKAKFPVDMIPLETQEEVVRKSQVLAIAAPGYPMSDRSIVADWIERGTTIAAVNQDYQFVPGEIDKCVDKFFLDDMVTYNTFIEQGRAYDGTILKPHEFGEYITGRVPGRERDDEVILSTPAGIGMDDVAPAKFIIENALKLGLGTILPL